jgi:hypothetical protein
MEQLRLKLKCRPIGGLFSIYWDGGTIVRFHFKRDSSINSDTKWTKTTLRNPLIFPVLGARATQRPSFVIYASAKPAKLQQTSNLPRDAMWCSLVCSLHTTGGLLLSANLFGFARAWNPTALSLLMPDSAWKGVPGLISAIFCLNLH